MARQTIDNCSLVEALLGVFQKHGYEEATLSRLSHVTGLKKSSLYHRFPAGKDDMVKAVLHHVRKQFQEHVIEPLLNRKESPEQRFIDMISVITAFYNSGKNNCLLNTLNLGETKTEIKEILNCDYKSWLLALIELGEELGMTHQEAVCKSKHFLIVVEGSLIIQRVTNDLDTFKNSLEYEKFLFLNTNDYS